MLYVNREAKENRTLISRAFFVVREDKKEKISIM